jgi:transposase
LKIGKNNQFTESYKREAVAKAEESGSIPQTARDLGISDKSLYRWSNQYGQVKAVVVGEARPAELVKRIEGLEKTLAIREEQIKVLKKAIGIVSESEGSVSR